MIKLIYNRVLIIEKKTKKLQLRKETIAVLNGERMAHVVGGNGIAPEEIMCPDGYVVEQAPDGNYICVPMDAGTSRNGEICQDTVRSFLKCNPTCEGNTCPINFCKK